LLAGGGDTLAVLSRSSSAPGREIGSKRRSR
jgi:hypothetical protein